MHVQLVTYHPLSLDWDTGIGVLKVSSFSSPIQVMTDVVDGLGNVENVEIAVSAAVELPGYPHVTKNVHELTPKLQ